MLSSDIPSASRMRPVKVFVIEDDLDHQTLVSLSLDAAGITDVTFFTNGEEALDYFLTRKPVSRSETRLIFIDLMLPRVGGLEILRRLRRDERWGSSFMAVLTCSMSREDRERSEEYGADAFISKPLSKEHIETLLSSLSGLQ